MGGSGGGSYFSGTTSPEELRKQVSKAEDATRSQEFEGAVTRMIGDVLSDSNARNAEVVKGHIETIRQALGQDVSGVVDMRFGGSIAKHTYIDGLSDADCLVIVDRSELREDSPDALKQYFAERLRSRLPNTEVQEGDLAVTVRFQDIDVQLIPALKSGAGVRIPDAGGAGWSETIRPDTFAEKLTRINQEFDGKVVPTIKLAKVLLQKLPENQRPSGYHVESLAIKVFEDYTGERNTKTMLKHLFAEAFRQIRQPIRDGTGQSLHVDDYLGGADSVRRKVVAEAVARIGRAMVNADGGASVGQWSDLFS